jgi:hypothetical protein
MENANGLSEVVAAALALSAALENAKRHAGGAVMRDYPQGLEHALRGALTGWRATETGRAALGLGPGPTYADNCRANAVADLAGAEVQLAAARAVVVDASYIGDRKARIEAAAAHVARMRRRLAELDGDVGGYRSWLRGFLADVKRGLADAVIEKPGITRLLERERANDAAAADRADPLGALARQAGL